MEKVTLQDLIEISIQDLKEHWFSEDDDPDLDPESYKNDDSDCDAGRLYFDIKENGDKIYMLPTLPMRTKDRYPEESYLVLFKDGRKMIMDADWPQIDDGHANVSDMHALNRDLIGADKTNSNYEIVIPKGSLVYELHADGDSFIALSPDLEKGLTTPGSGYSLMIIGKDHAIFDEYYNQEHLLDDREDLQKYDFVIK